jgi:hypothetical protein
VIAIAVLSIRGRRHELRNDELVDINSLVDRIRLSWNNLRPFGIKPSAGSLLL